MKKLLGIFAASFLMLMLCSCSSSTSVTLDEHERPQPTANGSWSVLIYMCGESGTKSQETIDDLCKMDYPSNVNFVIQTGGQSEWGTSGIDGEFLQRFVVQENSLFLKDQKQSANMGSYETLQDFLTWGVETFPAERYMLLIIGDGTGTEVLNDKLYDNDSLTVEELSYAVSLAGQRFDIVGFDGAYSASYEIASSLSPYAGYMIASEEKCSGWDYGRLAEVLVEYPYVTPQELGQLICDDYYAKCQEIGSDSMATLSLIDLSHISQLSQAFEGMAEIMASSTDSLDTYGRLARNALAAQSCIGSDDMVDLASLAGAIAENVGEPAQGVVNAITETVIYNVRGSLRPGANGLSIYYPQSIDEEKLNEYMLSMTSDSYKLFVKCISPGIEVADAYVTSDYRDSWAWCDYVGREFSISSYMTDDSRYALAITGDMNIVKDVRLNRYFFYPESNAYYSMGNDNNLDCDWENGQYMDNVTPVAPALNGNLIQADMEDEIKDVGKLYITPVLINDELADIISFYSWESGNFEITGIWQDGSFVNPGFNDRVATVHRIMEEEGTILTGKTFRPILGLRIENESLPSGTYVLEYQLEDIYSKIRKAVPAYMEKNGSETSVYQQQ